MGEADRHARRLDRILTYHTIPHVSRRSVPVINRFNHVLGWRTILQFLSSRVVESITFSVPDRNVLWNRDEDDFLVQTVAKYSTSNILGRDWIEVESEIPGRLSQQCQEWYRVLDILSELTFLFLCVTFRGSPLVPSVPVTSLEHTQPMTIDHVLTLLPILTMLDITYTQVRGFFSEPNHSGDYIISELDPH